MFGGINSYETPSYDIISKNIGYEIRRYHKQFLAQHTYEVPLDTNISAKAGIGFYPLFKYISGNNDAQTKISMTVPVIMQEIKSDNGIKRIMSFIMPPSKFNSTNELPTANDTNIQIVEQSNSLDMVCITFNMSMSTEKNVKKEQELREAAHRDGIQLSTNKNDVLYLGYNPPYTIPYFRRNEICIPVLNQSTKNNA